MIRSSLPGRRTFARIVLTASIATGGYIGVLGPISPELGVSLADAKPFYTRKRVNGRWITGKFPKQYARLPRAYARLAPEPAEPIVPQPPSRTLLGAAAAGAFATSLDPVDTTATLAPPGPLPDQPPPAVERLERLRDALQVRATEIVMAIAKPGLMPRPTAPSPVILAPAAKPDDAKVDSAPPPPPPATVAAISPPASKPGPLEPRSVSFDFETGVKTTVYESSVVREPFDVVSMKRFAAPVR